MTSSRASTPRRRPEPRPRFTPTQRERVDMTEQNANQRQTRAFTAEAPLRVGIIGTGGIARKPASSLAELDGRARVVGACDIDAERVEAFQAEWDVPVG